MLDVRKHLKKHLTTQTRILKDEWNRAYVVNGQTETDWGTTHKKVRFYRLFGLTVWRKELDREEVPKDAHH